MDMLLLVGAVTLLVAIGAATFSERLGLPALLLFLGLGLLMGDGALGIRFADAAMAHHLGFAALVLILAEGGFTTRWHDIRPTLPTAGLLATVGVGVSIGAVALFTHYVLGLPWAVAVLLSAILAPTDSAAVFSVLRNVGLPPKVKSVLEGESGLNDAPTVLLVIAATAMAQGHSPEGGLVGLCLSILVELIGGLCVGIAGGVLGVVTLRSLALPSPGLYPLATLGWSIMTYGLGTWLHLSGFAAVYVCALVLGNGQLSHRRATRSFVEGVAWIAQIGLFVMLGLLATPGRLTWQTALLGISIGAFLTFVARPLSVWLCCTPFRIPWRSQVFVAWAGLRGAVPIILATIPMEAGLPQASTIFDLVFVFVIVYTLLQGPTLPWLARFLGIATESVSEVEVEAAPLERIHAELLHVVVPQRSRLAGVSIRELRLPPNVVVSIVVRGDTTFVPHDTDVIRGGDELLVVAPSRARDEVVRRVEEVDVHGRLARWRVRTGSTSRPRPEG